MRTHDSKHRAALIALTADARALRARFVATCNAIVDDLTGPGITLGSVRETLTDPALFGALQEFGNLCEEESQRTAAMIQRLCGAFAGVLGQSWIDQVKHALRIGGARAANDCPCRDCAAVLAATTAPGTSQAN